MQFKNCDIIDSHYYRVVAKPSEPLIDDYSKNHQSPYSTVLLIKIPEGVLKIEKNTLFELPLIYHIGDFKQNK